MTDPSSRNRGLNWRRVLEQVSLLSLSKRIWKYLLAEKIFSGCFLALKGVLEFQANIISFHVLQVLWKEMIA